MNIKFYSKNELYFTKLTQVFRINGEERDSEGIHNLSIFGQKYIFQFGFTNLPKWLMFPSSNRKKYSNTFTPIALLSQDHKYAATIN